MSNQLKLSTDHRRLIAFLIPVAVAVVSYASLWRAAFVWDAKYQAIPMAWNWSEIEQIWTTNYWFSALGDPADSSEYRPLGSMILRSIVSAIGGQTGLVHGLCVIVHGLNALILCALILHQTKHLWCALASASLFAAHPAASEAVASVVGLNDMLVTSASLTMLIVVVRDRHAIRVNTAAIVFALAAVTPLIKESGVAVAGLAVLAAAVISISDRSAARRLLIAAVLGLVAYIGVRALLFPLDLTQTINPRQTMLNPLLADSTIDRLLNSLPVLATYVQLVVFPARLSAYYGAGSIPALVHPLDPGIWIAVTLICAAAGYAVLCWRSQHDWLPLALLAACAVNYAPISHWFNQLGTNVGERLLYPILPFTCWFAAHASRKLASRWRTSGLIVLVCLGIARISVRSNDWLDQHRFQAAAYRAMPSSAQVLINQSRTYYRQARLSAALDCVDRARAIVPELPSAMQLRVKVLVSQGRAGQAAAQLRRHLLRYPDRETALLLLNLYLASPCSPSGQLYPDSIDAFDQALARDAIDRYLAGQPLSLNSKLLGTDLDQIILLYGQYPELVPSPAWKASFPAGASQAWLRTELASLRAAWTQSRQAPRQ